MAKKKKLTPNQDKYKELRNRLRRKLRDLKKRGMSPNRAFKENWISDEIPKTVRKSELEKMQKALKNIYEYVRYYDALKEEYISGVERRKQERSEASRKGWEKRRENAMIIDQFWEEFDNEQEQREYFKSIPHEEDLILKIAEDMIANWRPDPRWSPELQAIKTEDKNLLKSVLEGAIAELGRTQVARNVNKHSDEFLSLVNDILYISGSKYKETGREGVRYAIQRVKDILYDRASTVRESIELTELAEQLNEGS